jgi:two-component system sensor histidine kinase UhpB
MWNQYKVYVVGASALLALQTALIAGLLVQRVRRRRVENALRESEGALRESIGQNQDLAGRLITAQEAERSRIGRDLHDDVCQRLAVLAMMLSGLKHRLFGSTPQPDLEEAMTTLQERTSTLVTDVRNLSHELHPSVLDHAGLVPVLKTHCDEFARHQKVDVTFSADEGVRSVDGSAALCIYRVTQEALGNTARHAHARHAHVRLARTPEGVELDVVDDGVGFDPEHRNGDGLGLRSIRERVRFAKGSVTIESQPGHGTKLLVRIPLSTVRSDAVAPAAT